MEEHRKILEALSSRDVKRAEELCRHPIILDNKFVVVKDGIPQVEFKKG